MRWNELYNSDTLPDYTDIEEYIGEGAPLWRELFAHLEKAYGVKPKMNYRNVRGSPDGM